MPRGGVRRLARGRGGGAGGRYVRASARRRSAARAPSATASRARATSARALARQPAARRRTRRSSRSSATAADADAAGRQGLGRAADGRADRLPRGGAAQWRLTSRPHPSPSWQRGRFASWLVTVDHKRIGILYLATSGLFFVAGGIMALLIRTQLAQADNGLHRARRLQRALHDARDDDDLPRRRADPRRLRQLPRAADDRRARHGLPAAERALVLALPLRRRRSCCSRSSPRAARPGAAGRATRRTRSTRRATARTSGSSRCTCSRSRRSPARSTSSSRSTTCARSGMSWTRLPLFVWSVEVYARPADRRAADALRRADAAAARPPGRHELLRPERGRQRRALPARLLVLRPPRGLHHDPAGDRDHLGGAPGLLAQADLRLQGDRVLDRRDRLLLDARLGAPHVHGRDARAS